MPILHHTGVCWGSRHRRRPSAGCCWLLLLAATNEGGVDAVDADGAWLELRLRHHRDAGRGQLPLLPATRRWHAANPSSSTAGPEALLLATPRGTGSPEVAGAQQAQRLGSGGAAAVCLCQAAGGAGGACKRQRVMLPGWRRPTAVAGLLRCWNCSLRRLRWPQRKRRRLGRGVGPPGGDAPTGTKQLGCRAPSSGQGRCCSWGRGGGGGPCRDGVDERLTGAVGASRAQPGQYLGVAVAASQGWC